MEYILLFREARELMENTHSYDSEIASKLDVILDDSSHGKEYHKTFIDQTLYECLELFENTHCDETEIYLKIEKYLGI